MPRSGNEMLEAPASWTKAFPKGWHCGLWRKLPSGPQDSSLELLDFLLPFVSRQKEVVPKAKKRNLKYVCHCIVKFYLLLPPTAPFLFRGKRKGGKKTLNRYSISSPINVHCAEIEKTCPVRNVNVYFRTSNSFQFLASLHIMGPDDIQ